MAHFDRAVPPGGEGKIKLKVNTEGRSGKTRKSAYVYTNDPENSRIRLTISALIQDFVHLSRRKVRLFTREDSTMTVTVKITAQIDKPLELNVSRFDLEDHLTYRIEQIKEGRVYNLYLTNIAGPPRIFSGSLELKTGYNEKPKIVIPIEGRIVAKSQ